MYSQQRVTRMFYFYREEALQFVRHIDVNATGNPDWVPHLNEFHKIVLLGVIDEMAKNNCPLDKEGVREIAQELAVVSCTTHTTHTLTKPPTHESLTPILNITQACRKKYDHLPVPSLWNGKKNADKSTTGKRITDPVCSHLWFRCFEKEFPAVHKYKTSSMSIMRANKATATVRDSHFKAFIDFLDR